MQTTVVTARKIQYNRMGKIISMCNKYEENGVAKMKLFHISDLHIGKILHEVNHSGGTENCPGTKYLRLWIFICRMES